MINTYNESSLHRSLKNMLSIENLGKTEIEVDGYICDIVCDNESIIEIQTKNLGKLTGKILNLLEKHFVTLVYPLALSTNIEYYDKKNLDSKLLLKRQSPVKKNIYNIFDELMGCFPVLLHDRFTLKVIETKITKERIKTENKVQSANKKRRFLKDWLPHDTTLDEILGTHTLNSVEDYLALLPQCLDKEFTVSDLITCANKPKIKKEQAYKMIWTYHKMGLIEFVGKDGRSKVYRIVNNCSMLR